jgi:hypothetical protein
MNGRYIATVYALLLAFAAGLHGNTALSVIASVVAVGCLGWAFRGEASETNPGDI